MIRVLVADDHGIVRAGIRHLLTTQTDFEVVGEAGDGREAVQLAESLQPDVVIMDIAMPTLNGIDAATQILKRRPSTAVIVLSMHDEEDYLLRALSVGVKGYLLKESAQADVVPAVKAVASGRPYFSAAIAQMLSEDYTRQLQRRGLTDSFDLLTDREREVMRRVIDGLPNKLIADELDISVRTVEVHRARVFDKMQVKSAVELANLLRGEGS